MKTYQFRLHTLLKTRRAREDFFLLALSKAQANQQRAQETLRDLQARREAFFDRFALKEQSVINIKEISPALHFLDGLCDQIEDQRRKISELNTEIAQLRLHCEAASRERKVLEGLDRRLGQEHRARAHRQDLRKMDELGLRTFSTKTIEPFDAS